MVKQKTRVKQREFYFISANVCKTVLICEGFRAITLIFYCEFSFIVLFQKQKKYSCLDLKGIIMVVIMAVVFTVESLDSHES